MLRKTITFTDFNGVQRTEDHCFNLTKAEIAEMEMSRSGGLSTFLRRITQERNMPEVAAAFKDILKRCYGRKSDDGRRFMKSEEIWKEFEESGAYSELYLSVLNDAGAMAEFIRAIAPSDMIDAINRKLTDGAATEGETPDAASDNPVH